nr:phosphatase PAP2 family protein [uncultured Kingella sp.]
MKHPNLNISLTLYTLLMLLIPIGFWANTYTWTLAQSAQTPDLNQFLILLTTTGGSKPYAISFSIVFTLILAYFVRRQYRPLTVIAVCICAVVGTQAIKTGAKAIFKEPRPYVVQLAEQIHISTADFYALKKPEKRELIAHTPHNPDEQILSDYQQHELGYSFPSGHTTFAVAWLLLVVGFTQNWREGSRIAARCLVALWAAGVLYSRVKLGAHFPMDLFASTLIVWAWHIALFRYGLPYFHQRFGQPIKAA